MLYLLHPNIVSDSFLQTAIGLLYFVCFVVLILNIFFHLENALPVTSITPHAQFFFNNFSHVEPNVHIHLYTMLYSLN